MNQIFERTCRAKNGDRINITRLVDSQSLWGKKLLPLSNDADFVLYSESQNDPLYLAKLYAALSQLTGESDNEYDEFKGSFSFRFLLDSHKGDTVGHYLLWIFQYRSFLRISLYEIVSKNDKREANVVIKPSEQFSENEIKGFIFYFTNSLLKEAESELFVPHPFVKAADSNLLLCGYTKEEGYFVKEFNNEHEYKSQKEFFSKQVNTQSCV